MSNTSKFKDTMQRWRTVSLFQETAIRGKEYVLYTLEEARELYLAENDPTGYNFAVNYLGGWKHWNVLKQSSVLAPHIEAWEEELDVKLRATGVLNMVDLATDRKNKSYQANKFLVDGGWIKKGAGRPSKAEKQKAVKQHLEEYSELNQSVDLKH